MKHSSRFSLSLSCASQFMLISICGLFIDDFYVRWSLMFSRFAQYTTHISFSIIRANEPQKQYQICSWVRTSIELGVNVVRSIETCVCECCVRLCVWMVLGEFTSWNSWRSRSSKYHANILRISWKIADFFIHIFRVWSSYLKISHSDCFPLALFPCISLSRILEFIM